MGHEKPKPEKEVWEPSKRSVTNQIVQLEGSLIERFGVKHNPVASANLLAALVEELRSTTEDSRDNYSYDVTVATVKVAAEAIELLQRVPSALLEEMYGRYNLAKVEPSE